MQEVFSRIFHCRYFIFHADGVYYRKLILNFTARIQKVMENQLTQMGKRLRELRTILEVSPAEMAQVTRKFWKRYGGKVV